MEEDASAVQGPMGLWMIMMHLLNQLRRTLARSSPAMVVSCDAVYTKEYFITVSPSKGNEKKKEGILSNPSVVGLLPFDWLSSYPSSRPRLA